MVPRAGAGLSPFLLSLRSMLLEKELDALRVELSVKAKNGLDFVLAASVVWAASMLVWALPGTPVQKGFLTFFIGGLTLPLAWGLSKAFGTVWALPHNPLQPLGLWLNVAQLFYFPFLLFTYSHQPAYFIMTYGIITGAHFFPYAWFYFARPYAVMAGVIAGGCWLIGVRTATTAPYAVPAFATGALLVLALLLLRSYRRRQQAQVVADLGA